MSDLMGYRDTKLLHILRNPWGYSHEELKKARLQAADELEYWKKWAEDMLKWCEDNGLDITTRGIGVKV